MCQNLKLNFVKGVEVVEAHEIDGQILFDKCVEHINIQSIGHQNKYIWAQKTVKHCTNEVNTLRDVKETSMTGHDDISGLAVLTRQRKSCGHDCYPSSTSKCCPCSDLRPMLEGDIYPCYVDGVGWMNTESRDAGYCPICNPKSYGAWKKRIQREREKKIAIKLKEKELKELERAREEEDKIKAAALVSFCSTVQ